MALTQKELELIYQDLEEEKISIAQFVRKKRQEILKDLQKSYKGDELIEQYIDYVEGNGSEHYIVSNEEVKGIELPDSGKHYKEFLKRYQEEDYNERTLYGRRANKMEVWAWYIDDLVYESVSRQIKSILTEKGYDVENLWQFAFGRASLEDLKIKKEVQQ